MSVSAIFGVRITTLPSAPTLLRFDGPKSTVIECSSRPKKKATSHHMKTRPKKTQPWDIRRKPTVYPPLPPLPPDWSVLSSSADAGPSAVTAEALVSAES